MKVSESGLCKFAKWYLIIIFVKQMIEFYFPQIQKCLNRFIKDVETEWLTLLNDLNYISYEWSIL